MKNQVLRRLAGRAGLVLAVTSALALAAAQPALADTSQATAQAASVGLLGLPVVTSGQVVASNDGTSETRSGNTMPSISLPGGVVLSAGALFQDAVAGNDGTSGACAGVVGPNGVVQIGPAGSCIVAGAPTGLVLDLGLSALRADVITAGCAAASNGTTTGTATLANARITDPTGTVTLLSLPVNPAPNTVLSLPGIVDVNLNEQSSATAGQLSVTALHLTLLGGVDSGLQARLGAVTCGPNAQTAPIPMLPAAGLPIAGGTLLAGAVIFWCIRRRSPSKPADG